MVVGVGHELNRLFGRSIRRDGVIDVLHLGKECRLGTAIDRRRRGIDKVGNVVLHTEIHQLHGALHVGVNVNVGIDDGIADASAGSKMTHPRWLFFLENLGNKIGVSNITSVDGQPLFIRLKLPEEFKVGLLHTSVIVVVHLVNNNDVVATGQKLLGYMRGDETSRTCNKDFLASNVGLDNVGGRTKVTGHAGASNSRANHVLHEVVGTCKSDDAEADGDTIPSDALVGIVQVIRERCKSLGGRHGCVRGHAEKEVGFASAAAAVVTTTLLIWIVWPAEERMHPCAVGTSRWFPSAYLIARRMRGAHARQCAEEFLISAVAVRTYVLSS